MSELELHKDGNLLRVYPATLKVRQILSEELTYTRVKYLATAEERRQHKGKTVATEDVYCFRIKQIQGKTHIVTNSGYQQRVTQALRAHGFRVKLIEHRPHAHPEVYQPDWDLLAEYDFRHKQKETLEAICAAERGQIWWPTGTGKSFLIGMLCRALNQCNIAVVTKFASVLEDRYHQLNQMLPSVGIYHSKKKKQGRRVMVVSSGCLHHFDPKDFDVLIADEHHELATAKMFGVFAQWRRNRMYGFSANFKDRMDGADFELEGIFGPLVAKMTYEEAVEHGMIVPIHVYWRNVLMDTNPAAGMEGVPRLRHGIWRNEYRNELIANDAKCFPDDQVLITVKTLDHACHLKKLLPDYEMCYAPSELYEEKLDMYYRWGLIPRDEPIMTDDRLRRLKKNFESGKLKKAIATSVWNRGVNFHQLQVLIRGDASSSAIDDTQIPGRMSRITDTIDKKCGILIDYKDQFDDNLRRKAAARKRDYKAKGWLQIEPDDEAGGGDFRQLLMNV